MFPSSEPVKHFNPSDTLCPDRTSHVGPSNSIDFRYGRSSCARQHDRFSIVDAGAMLLQQSAARLGSAALLLSSPGPRESCTLFGTKMDWHNHRTMEGMERKASCRHGEVLPNDAGLAKYLRDCAKPPPACPLSVSPNEKYKKHPPPASRLRGSTETRWAVGAAPPWTRENARTDGRDSSTSCTGRSNCGTSLKVLVLGY
jgi:hypothetical protein